METYKITPIKIKDDPLRQIIEIEGIKFSYGFFKFFGKESNEGAIFQILKHKDGEIIINRLED